MKINSRKALILTVLMLVLASPAGAKDVMTVARETGPAVVLIQTYFADELLGLGSGFIVDEAGTIVTNYHVIQYSDEAWVYLIDGTELEVEGVLDYDEEQDIAVIKVKGRDLPALKLGDSDSIGVGEQVVAIGNPRGLENTVSDGIVSARRTFEGYEKDVHFIQLTAPISPGSSGGALFDTSSAVIGMTTASYRESQNLNFAVPVNLIKPMLASTELKELAAVSGSILGMSSDDVSRYAWSSLDGGDIENAAKYFDRLAEMEPGKPDGFLGLGEVNYEKEEFKKAAEYFEKGIEVDPENEEAYQGAARAYGRAGDDEKALQILQSASEIDPANTETIGLLGSFYEKAGSYPEAVSTYQRQIAAEPAVPNPYLAMGSCQLKLDDFSQAKSTFDKALVVKPDLVSARIGLGYAYLGMGKTGTAVKEFETALAVRTMLSDEEIVEALEGLGQARLAMGHHKKAEEVYGQMLTMDSNSADAHYGLGRAYAAGGNLDAALKEADILKELDKELAERLNDEIKAQE